MTTHSHPLLRRIRSWLTGSVETLPEYEVRHDLRHEDEAREFLRRQEIVRVRLEALEGLTETKTARKREHHGGN